jgi:putative membrane protein
MRIKTFAVAAATCFGVAAVQATEGTAPGTATPNPPAATQGDANATTAGKRDRAGATEQDRDFVINAAQSGVAELRASKMALDKASMPAVKKFADRMVRDHAKANDRLMALAKARGIDVDKEPSLLQRGKLELVEHSGNDFDSRFIDHFGVDAHKNAIEVFEKQVRQGNDRQLVAFARETLPKLQDHLRMAQDLQKSMQARGDAGDQSASREDRKGSAEDRRTQGAAAAPAVQTQSPRVSDTGIAPPAVDNRAPGTPAKSSSGK